MSRSHQYLAAGHAYGPQYRIFHGEFPKVNIFESIRGFRDGLLLNLIFSQLFCN